MTYNLCSNYLSTRTLPIWRVEVVDVEGRNVHAEQNVCLDSAQRAAAKWCKQHQLVLAERREWMIGPPAAAKGEA
jgi:hypothetical protein